MSRWAFNFQYYQRGRFKLWLRLGRLPLLLLAALSLTLLLAAGNVVTAERLFQSPPAQSPVPQPPANAPAQQPTQPEQQAAPQPQAQPPAQSPAAPPTQQPAAAPGQPPLPEKSLKPAQKDKSTTDETTPRNLTLDTAELIDTVIVSGAYIWLCCGIILFLLIPLTLLILYIRGRSKIVQEEEF
jgi:uncharacterized membrane protein